MIILAIKPAFSGIEGLAQRVLFQKKGIKFFFVGRRLNPFRFSNFYNLFLIVGSQQDLKINFTKYNFQIMSYFLMPYLLNTALYSKVAHFSHSNFFFTAPGKLQLQFLFFIFRLKTLFFKLILDGNGKSTN